MQASQNLQKPFKVGQMDHALKLPVSLGWLERSLKKLVQIQLRCLKLKEESFLRDSARAAQQFLVLKAMRSYLSEPVLDSCSLLRQSQHWHLTDLRVVLDSNS